MEQREFAKNAQAYMARSIRLAVVQNQYDAGRLTLEQAKDLLCRPLTPGGVNFFDDSDQLRIKSEHPEITTKTGKLQYQIKYFAAQHLEFEITCPRCKEIFQLDLGETGFLEYPKLGNWDKLGIACCDCGHEFNIEYKLDLSATMSVKVAEDST